MKQKTIGLDIEHPKGTCTDKNCPFHSTQKLRGRILKGKIIKVDPFKSATITFERIYPIPKYERYEKRTSRLRVHNPPCINAQLGNEVIIAETKPISKTKHFVIIGVEKQ